MKNSYGNYVVQKALQLASSLHKSKLIIAIQKNIDKLGDKKLIMKWRSIIDKHILEENIKFSSVFNNPNFNLGFVNINNKSIGYNNQSNDVILNNINKL